jgi:hypothetical protein
MSYARGMLHRYDVDWTRHGYEDAELDELAELSLRTVQSIIIDSGNPPRTGAALRRFVARWLGPLLPRAGAVDGIAQCVRGGGPRQLTGRPDQIGVIEAARVWLRRLAIRGSGRVPGR